MQLVLCCDLYTVVDTRMAVTWVVMAQGKSDH